MCRPIFARHLRLVLVRGSGNKSRITHDHKSLYNVQLKSTMSAARSLGVFNLALDGTVLIYGGKRVGLGAGRLTGIYVLPRKLNLVLPPGMACSGCTAVPVTLSIDLKSSYI